jgi:hypothetical protein
VVSGAGPRRPGEAGFALAVTLLAVFLSSVAVAVIFLSLAVRLRSIQQETRGVTLTTLCDAALAQTLAGLAQGGSSGVAPYTFAGGTIASQVQTVDSTHLVVTATAQFGGKGRTVVATVERDDSGTRVVAWRRLSG